MENSERDKAFDRVCELEKKAKDKYIDCIEWNSIIGMLSDEEYAEYEKLQANLKTTTPY